MATFIWPVEVQWPPPAHILLNYDVMPPPADAVVETQNVLRSTDVAPLATGAVRVTLVPDRVAGLEGDAALINQRVTAIETRINVPPVVVDETAEHPASELVVGQVIRTMQASGLPTGWEIFGQTMNGLPTTGYWEISAKGQVTPTEFGVGGVRKHSNVEILVRAVNEFGSGDGKLDINFN